MQRTAKVMLQFIPIHFSIKTKDTKSFMRDMHTYSTAYRRETLSFRGLIAKVIVDKNLRIILKTFFRDRQIGGCRGCWGRNGRGRSSLGRSPQRAFSLPMPLLIAQATRAASNSRQKILAAALALVSLFDPDFPPPFGGQNPRVLRLSNNFCLASM